MKRLITASLFCVFAASLPAINPTEPALIPAPQKLERREGAFQFTAKTRILADKPAAAAAQFLASKLRPSTGFAFAIISTDDYLPPVQGDIVLTTKSTNAGLGSEGYDISASADVILLRAAEPAGFFYGVQTLLQLAPPEVFASAKPPGEVQWTVPAVEIQDQPRFPWRGFMLDVSRHFFTKDEVKRVLDVMALHKLNTFHWHLVDDHGWRIEIKKYPRLTEVGAWRPEIGFNLDPKSTTNYRADGKYGGFYTQDDIREVVAYAASKHITVVPEIEMPGHSTAALVAYPELGCTGGPYTLELKGGVFHGVLCAGKDKTFEFLQDVLTEVFALFPGKYVHIGGDEVPKDNWKKCPLCQARMKKENLKDEHELQSYFIRRIEKFFTAKNRALIGWSEIAEGGLAPSAAIMDWIGGGLEAARGGHDVVMTPTGYCYVDYYQWRDTGAEPKAIGGYLPLSKVYSFEPIPKDLPAELQKHILGGQCNLWTEYIANLPYAEYMAFPRLAALAEVGWSPKEARNFDNFKARLQIHNHRLDQLNVNYRRDVAAIIGEWTPADITTTNAAGTAIEWDVTPHVNAAGQYRFTFEWSRGNNGMNITSAVLLENSKEVARDAHAGFTGTAPKRPFFALDLPAWKQGASYVLRATVSGVGGTDSSGAVNLVFKPVAKTP